LCMSYPVPFTLPDFLADEVLVSSFPQGGIGDLFEPSDVYDVA
jgi:hypothetical protein